LLLSIYYNLQAVALQYQDQTSTQLRQSIIHALLDSDQCVHEQQQQQQLLGSMDHENVPLNPRMDDDNTHVNGQVNNCGMHHKSCNDSVREHSKAQSMNTNSTATSTTTEGDKDNMNLIMSPPLNNTSANDREATNPTTASATNTTTDPQSTSTLPILEVATTMVTNKASVLIDYAKVVWQVTSLERPAPILQVQIVFFLILLWAATLSLLCFGSPPLPDSSDDDNNRDDGDDNNTALLSSATSRENLVAYVTLSNLLFFYGSPLSTIQTVVFTRCSQTIHVPTMITNTANGTFWCIYGLAIQDWFVGIPNGIGAAFGFVGNHVS
jgi:hypothetical protein